MVLILKSTLHYKLKDSNSYGFVIEPCVKQDTAQHTVYFQLESVQTVVYKFQILTIHQINSQKMLLDLLSKILEPFFVVNNPIGNYDDEEYDIIERFCNFFQVVEWK